MKMMLNITCVNERPTGIEQFALQIAREYRKIDPSSVVVAAGRFDGLSGAIVSRLLSLAKGLAGKYEYLVRAAWDQTWFRLIVARCKPDLLFFPIQDGLLFSSVRQIVTIHDLHYLHFDAAMPECRGEIESFRTRLYRLKMPHLLKQCAAIVAVSEATKRDIVSRLGIHPDRICVINNGYDEERFHVIEETQPVLDWYGLHAGSYFLYIGSILRHKNIVRLVHAFAQLESSTKLILAGVCKDGGYLKEINETARRLGVAGRLSYLDYVPADDLPYLYNGALAFVLPSLHEGFGIPLIEAMACGTPVITSDCSAMPEVAGEAAILVNPYAVDSIAAAMGKVLHNPRMAAAMKTAGLERARKFSWAGSARKLYDLCQTVSET